VVLVNVAALVIHFWTLIAVLIVILHVKLAQDLTQMNVLTVKAVLLLLVENADVPLAVLVPQEHIIIL